MSEQAKQLIRTAFQQARAAGKPDWHRMSLAVLKNRILHLTDTKFREQEFGVRNFTDFVRLAADIVDIDQSRRPPTVSLKVTGVEQAAPTDQLRLASHELPGLPAQSRSGRLRPDLWAAVMDYTSGQRYGWDAAHQRARPLREGEDLPVLPTITAEDLRKWRTEFTAAHDGTVPDDQVARLHHWRDAGLASAVLPGQLRKPWNAELKRRATSLLDQWFEENKIAPPAIMVPAERVAPLDDTEELRRLVLECVRLMTRDELASLKLPVSSVVRSRK